MNRALEIGTTLVNRSLGSFMASGRDGNALLILTYHRIAPVVDPVVDGTTDPEIFAMHMCCLARDFHVLTLAEAAKRLRNGDVPRRTVCVTFDDGYADNFTAALPVLERLGLKATFFVATGFIDGGRMWNDTVITALRRAAAGRIDLCGAGLGEREIRDEADRRQLVREALDQLKHHTLQERDARVAALADAVGVDLPNDLMMTGEQLRQLHAAGMELGAHTVNHPILAQLSTAEAEAEISGSRRALETLTGAHVVSFAYPNGRPGVDYTANHVESVRRAGFEVAVSTAWGAARRGADPLQLPRIGSWDRSPLRFNLRLLAAYRSKPAGSA